MILEIGTKVRDKEFPNIEGVITDIDTAYAHRMGRVYYGVTFSLPPTFLWYQEKDLEIICHESTTH